MNPTKQNTRKWWGWGYVGKSYSIENRPNVWPFLKQKLALTPRKCRIIALDDIELPPPKLTAELLKELTEIYGENNINTSKVTRISHSFGQSYGDVICLRKGNIDHAIDVVVYPRNEEQIQKTIIMASKNRLAIIPYGGGTSVTGNLELRNDESYDGGISMDMRKMNMIQIDNVSQTVTAQAGIFGPALEEAVNAQGLTLGHFPQSFEFSTLGGWLATRSAGQNSTRYGKIEDMLISLRAITPTGIIETKSIPASSTGPSIDQLFVGSEGTLGIISQATLQLQPLSASTEMCGILFKRFLDGVQAVRAMSQAGIVPSVLRISDEPETEATFMFRSQSANPIKRVAEKGGMWFLNQRDYSFQKGSLMILVFEGSPQQVALDKSAALRICKRHRAVSLGNIVGKAWHKERFLLPYLRDVLLDNGVMIDTLETAITWDKINNLYFNVRNAISKAIEKQGMKPLVLTHMSHVYRTGASLYFIFMANQKIDAELEQWQEIKAATIEAILHNGGTLSHHHGVGRDHARWFEDEVGHLGKAFVLASKSYFDPQHILNPENFG
ncbi:MAG: hypothetical protein B6242_11955 [Anaerolineaceae bacterium 4572_78]|nr:MAG: hypothetical protein B6242_11955 [Anaerolineaceae bacterium 4572_78]